MPAASKKVETKSFYIDCSAPASDEIFDTAHFIEFLNGRIKVDGKVGNLGKTVTVSAADGEDGKVLVTSNGPFSKRYLKYLTKKYLKKKKIRDWLRVVSTDSSGYVLKYFELDQEEEAEEEEAE
mmetsp:Transcript_36069/g.94578  ORF Transcript_36069/g.94578 Transcript_36069/m.94578 type:complete len:124 (+) Transcript_36069:85-456(+)|eukprot:CAMPEP_0182915152 /NCGR_PEP_ID=MMETSP0105_2-20130417/134_1 /TAXON_ID=81532 ORGANISM="Acanthoeca-like sp., Strain 10tr" /NCGR_SAMPLE_ID=MMETSP0105_2 /ASSEMBLY_ACC=CAM_ASM_000205 /LENGTH=123 /DNA_ID=CAMNT_0025051979 /DNA_START=66 /DNA_END=437 /DNA_ORIENTATION=+